MKNLIIVATTAVDNIEINMKNNEIIVKDLKSKIVEINTSIKEQESSFMKMHKLLYENKERLLHLEEILRLASIHIPRLSCKSDLTPQDYAELEKWIKRTKNRTMLCSIWE